MEIRKTILAILPQQEYRLFVLQLSHLDREYEAIPTTNYRTNDM